MPCSTIIWCIILKRSVIDFETTGLYLEREDCAISLGTIIIEAGDFTITCIDSMHSFIRTPHLDWVEETRAIHHISSEEVAKAPEPSLVCAEYVKLLEKYNIRHAAAWNHGFDKKVLEKLFRSQNLEPPGLKWDELQPFEKANLENHSDKVRCDYVRNLSAHHALSDCARALCVYAENVGYDLDIASLIRVMKHYDFYFPSCSSSSVFPDDGAEGEDGDPRDIGARL